MRNIPLLLCIALSSCHKRDAGFRIQCESEMYQISVIGFSLWRNGTIIKKDQDLMKDIISYGSKFEGIFAPEKGRIKNDDILDPKGRPYQISFENGVVTIWSLGLDGIDQNGQGDDIVFRERITD